MKFVEKYKTKSNECDINNQISMSNIFGYLQDSANCQMEKEKPSYNELFEAGYAYVLSRMVVRMNRPLFQHEDIDVQTWSCGARGYQSDRCYQISKDGEIIVEAASVWAILGVNDKKIYRPKDLHLHYGEDVKLSLYDDMRFVIPKAFKFSEVGNYVVGYADCDLNGHMNNAKYPDAICNFLPIMKNKFIKQININYLSEAILGDTIGVTFAQENEVIYVKTYLNSGKCNVEAKIILE